MDEPRSGERASSEASAASPQRMEQHEHGRVLVAKVGLDGHDRGVKVVARILRDAGYEVIYTGLFQTPDTVAAAAVDEDVDAIGLSMLSGAHMTLAPLVVDKVRERGADIPVVVGGIVPDADVAKLLEAGVAGVLTPGSTGDQVVDVVRTAIASRA
jgi:methylmalonyl-CoA mutase C-terminal domain/subunit